MMICARSTNTSVPFHVLLRLGVREVNLQRIPARRNARQAIAWLSVSCSVGLRTATWVGAFWTRRIEGQLRIEVGGRPTRRSVKCRRRSQAVLFTANEGTVTLGRMVRGTFCGGQESWFVKTERDVIT